MGTKLTKPQSSGTVNGIWWKGERGLLVLYPPLLSHLPAKAQLQNPPRAPAAVMDFQVVVLAGGFSKKLVPLVSKVSLWFPNFISGAERLPFSLRIRFSIIHSIGRLPPWLQEVPKALLPVANRPVLSYVLDLLEQSNLKDLIVVSPSSHSLPESAFLILYLADWEVHMTSILELVLILVWRPLGLILYCQCEIRTRQLLSEVIV